MIYSQRTETLLYQVQKQNVAMDFYTQGWGYFTWATGLPEGVSTVSVRKWCVSPRARAVHEDGLRLQKEVQTQPPDHTDHSSSVPENLRGASWAQTTSSYLSIFNRKLKAVLLLGLHYQSSWGPLSDSEIFPSICFFQPKYTGVFNFCLLSSLLGLEDMTWSLKSLQLKISTILQSKNICKFYFVAIEMHSSAVTVSRGCSQLHETEVCILHVCKLGELPEGWWKNLQNSALKRRWAIWLTTLI